MKISILNILGIYPEDIDHAWEECESALEGQGLDRFTGELEQSLKDEFTEIDLNNATNSVIDLMFNICKGIIEREHPGQEVTFYVNGYDSHLYPGTNPESAEGRLEASGLSFEERQELLGDEGFMHDLKELFDDGGDICIYESEAECGADNADNGCREEDDTDEGFCEFLADNYLNNYSTPKDICIILKSGRVVMASD